jgi:hypothetical protein
MTGVTEGHTRGANSVRKVVQKEMYSLDELTAMGGPSKPTLRRLIDSGILLTVHLSPRCVRVSREDWLNYIEQNRNNKAA